jgi:hypothetical protein
MTAMEWIRKMESKNENPQLAENPGPGNRLENYTAFVDVRGHGLHYRFSFDLPYVLSNYECTDDDGGMVCTLQIRGGG